MAGRWRAEQRFLRDCFVACPDCHWEAADLIAEGNRLAGRDTCRGTHRGTFMGVAPTGKAITMESLHLWRVAEGRIVAHWNQGDQLGLLRQLGALPAAQAAG